MNYSLLRECRRFGGGRFLRRFWLVTAVFSCLGFVASVCAQTNQQIPVYSVWTRDVYAPANFEGRIDNGFSVATVHGTNTITVELADVPAGLTPIIRSNAFPFVLSPSITNRFDTNVPVQYRMTNIAVGDHTFEYRLSGTDIESRTQRVTLHIISDMVVWNASDSNNAAWSVPTNWVPGPLAQGYSVKLGDPGAVTNFVDTSLTLSRLSYVRFGNPNIRATIINPGVTVLVTNGFTVNSDTDGASKTHEQYIIGTNGASLIVSNANSDFSVNCFSTGNGGRFNMASLDTFVADVNRFAVSDLSLNPEGAYGSQHVRDFFFARTNIIKAHYQGSFDGLQMTNAIQFWNHEDETAYQNGSAHSVNLGISNLFLADGIIIGKARVAADGNIFRFNIAAAITTNNPVAVFRGLNGGRMAFFGLGVDAGTNRMSGNSTSARADFSAGTVDILVDTMWLGRNRQDVATNANARVQGQLTVSKGIVDANVVRVAFQQYTNDSRQLGRITINGGGTLIVNQLLDLGYTSGEYTAGSSLVNGFAELVLQSNSVARVNAITAGGLTQQTTNSIILTTGGSLILSNNMGSADAPVGRLSMTDAQLTLHVVDENTNVFVRTLNAVAGPVGNRINIASLPNFTSYPVQIPLISYQTIPAFNIGMGTLPEGFTGFLTNNADGLTVDAVITTNAPNSLTWHGGASGVWDLSSTNWTAAGTLARFNNGDFVRFDDSGSNPAVNVTTLVRPAQSPSQPGVVVSNSAVTYTIFGVGTIQGSAQVLKQGPGVLVLDGTMETPVVVEEGVVTGSGTIGAAVVQGDGALLFSGNISAGLLTAGITSLSGGLTGPTTVQAGGVLTNTGTIQGTVGLQRDTLLVNVGSLTNTTSWSVPSNAVLANWNYILQSGNLNVDDDGTLTGEGIIARPDSVTAANARVALAGTYTPGGEGLIGTSTIFTRLDFNSGSRTVFELDIAGGSNDVVVADSVNFSTGNDPARFIITNIGLGSFASGQSFQILRNSFDDPFVPDNTNTIVFLMQPVSPGLGLIWDTSDLRTNGILRVASVSTTPVDITFGITVATNASSTNNVLSMSWPEDHRGWRLELQTNTLQIGISNNWSTMPFSHLSNEITVPFVLTNPAVFYRLAHP